LRKVREKKSLCFFLKKKLDLALRGARGGEDGADREEGAHMHHADPATLAVAGTQARRQGGCLGETLPLLFSSTPDIPPAAHPLRMASVPEPAVRCVSGAAAGGLHAGYTDGF